MSNFKIQINSYCKIFLIKLKNSNNSYYIKQYEQLCNTISEIKNNPFNSKYKKLKNSEELIRARSGEYRIIYFIKNRTIFITRIGLRKYIYKKGKGCEHLLKHLH